jgi:HK97 family phage portal protein
MGIFDYLGFSRRGALEERSTAIVMQPKFASSGVTTSDALSLASVYRAVTVLATAMKQMGIHAYREDIKVSPTPLWIRQPDAAITREVWMESTVNSLALSGNAYWLISRNPRGETVNLQVLNPFNVFIKTDEYGNTLGYTYRGTKEYSLNEIQHLALMRVPGNAYGLGPIQAAQQELMNARDTRDYAATWFTDSGVPSGVLKSDQMLSPDQAKAAKDAWNLTAGAKNGVAVLGNGLNFQAMYLNPKDAMFIETQAFNVQQVARLFGVPANMILASVDGNSMTYTNMEQEQIAFVRYTLSQYIVEIESAMSALANRGVDVEINTDSLLRADTLTRYQAHQIAISAGWMTVDEVRELEDLPPLNPNGVPDAGLA